MACPLWRVARCAIGHSTFRQDLRPGFWTRVAEAPGRLARAEFGRRVALNSIDPGKLVEVNLEQVFAKWHIARERAPRGRFRHRL